jgi:hypothetical protein
MPRTAAVTVVLLLMLIAAGVTLSDQRNGHWRVTLWYK